MSVHIAEVMQIFVCIITGMPVMRTPLQILFLILVTDLPPSIALGILFYCDGQILQTEINKVPGFEGKLMDARTVAFISLVWAENVRSYCSRSFDKPFYVDLLGNKHMQQAIILAQICLYVAVLLPFFSDKILQLRGVKIGIEGWLLALIGPIGCLALCELCKLITARQMQQYQSQLAMRHLAMDKARQEKADRMGFSKAAPEPQKIGKTTEAGASRFGGIFGGRKPNKERRARRGLVSAIAASLRRTRASEPRRRHPPWACAAAAARSDAAAEPYNVTPDSRFFDSVRGA
eukprot:CAMPEP_0170387826 /NCGR_PEP_ID=MMETSP0117_2-20130122/17762_1 /TAXON_ID=400756 /ORGANISM="Durinskia baltica, Strain CSIRO CS-38" /LENGTH=290 /DNA_ID=CAMNT_0010643715 /DNA_START=19 /DNA_END=888 /DNA_ORIENTATION=-